MIFIKRIVLAFAFYIIASSPLWAQNAFQREIKAQYSLTDQDLQQICTLDATEVDASFYIKARELPNGSLKAVNTADIQVDYVGAWPNEAFNAFQYAMSIWESHLDSDVPIRIEANWVQLGERTLGSAGPTQILQIEGGEANTWYSIAQASAVSGIDYVSQSQGTSNEVNHDVRININSNWDSWYFGTDAQTPAGLIDFVTVVMHEIGHGIGFTGSMRVPSGLSTAQWGYGTPNAPLIYDRYVIDGDGNDILNTSIYPNNSGVLYDAVTGARGGIYAAGVNTILSNNGAAARLYAPSDWAGGSSYSHLDQTTYTNTVNALMRPQVDRAFAIHSPGPVTCGIFYDTGWPLGPACQAMLDEEALLAVNTADVSFGVTNEGDNIRDEITLTNPASSPGLLVGRLSLSGSSSFYLTNQEPIFILEPGESRSFTVSYRPERQEKAEGEIKITHNGTNLASPYTITLQGEALPENKTFILEQNYPNPFNASTNIPFALATDAFVRLDVYDLMGRHVQSLINEQRPSGRYSARLNANEFASGVYIYRIIIDGTARSGKLLLAK